jgi:hypothetical protein
MSRSFDDSKKYKQTHYRLCVGRRKENEKNIFKILAEAHVALCLCSINRNLIEVFL